MADMKVSEFPPTTLGQLLNWNDHHQFELIDGVTYRSGKHASHPYTDVVGAIRAQIDAASSDAGWVPIPEGALIRLGKVEQDDADVMTMVRPDAALACEPARLDSMGLRGAPDWIAEVVTRSSAILDHIIKRHVYERVGTAEYWLVDPYQKLLTVYQLGNTGYEKPRIHELAGKTELSLLPGVFIDWDAVPMEEPGAVMD